MTDGFCVLIPARLDSTRLPGKVLLDINGKPLIRHVHESAADSDADRVIIATDHQQVLDTAESFQAECVLTSPEHRSGTDRLAECAKILGLDRETIIVNLQGDEFGLPAQLINQVASLLQDNPDILMATLCEPLLDEADRNNPDIVKVVFDANNSALYFSRHAIPWVKKGIEQTTYRHIGIYAYRAGFLETFTGLPECELERQESLEQLRALYHGYHIKVGVACQKPGIGIDTEDDLNRARNRAGDSL